jgi:UDP-N-acetylmuramoyl-tripeptide--D-alanyl-D-alanine ligase
MNYTTIILLLGFIKYMHQVLYAIYLLQLKEYRHDRLSEHLLRKHKHVTHALFHTGIGAPFSLGMLPRPTGKALLLTAISLSLGAFLIFALGLSGAILGLLFSLGIVLLSLSLLAPIEHLLRQRTYAQAREKIIKLKKHGLVVIGITGSYGKTSTKDFLAHILSFSYPVLATQNSVNTPLGVARTIIKNLHSRHRFFVVEMGAYKVGEIAELCDIALPDMGVVTGISNQHLSLFGSQENIIKGKSELFDSLKPESHAYISAQSPHQHQSANDTINIVEYSLKNLSARLQKAVKATNLPPELIQNIIPGILIAEEIGLSEKDILTAISTLKASEKTMATVVGREGATIIDDTRNASEMGVGTAISFLESLPQKTKILIMPCIIELGEESEEAHRRIGKMLKSNSIEAIITTNDYFAYIAETAPKNKVRLLTDPDFVCYFIQKKLSKDCAIMLEGKLHPTIINFVMKNNGI